MKVNFDTANWFKDKVLTISIVVLVFTILNTILLCVLLSHNCPRHEFAENWANQWWYHTMMIKK